MSLLLPFTLATILTTDPLGYECVHEENLEVAFALGGKGMRAAQTCIPEPCEETLTEETLASYTGYRDEVLYADYRRRMSDVCGTPTAWQEKGIGDEDLLWAVFDGGSGSIPLPEPYRVAQLPWTDPFAARPVNRNRDGDSPTFGGWNGGGGFGGGGGGGRPPGGGGGNTAPKPVVPTSVTPLTVKPVPPPDPFDPPKPWVDPKDPPKPWVDPNDKPPPDVPSEVPLPAPFFLLSAAAAALALLRRRRHCGRAR